MQRRLFAGEFCMERNGNDCDGSSRAFSCRIFPNTCLPFPFEKKRTSTKLQATELFLRCLGVNVGADHGSSLMRPLLMLTPVPLLVACPHHQTRCYPPSWGNVTPSSYLSPPMQCVGEPSDLWVVCTTLCKLEGSQSIH